MINDTPQGQTNHCPMCEDAAKELDRTNHFWLDKVNALSIERDELKQREMFLVAVLKMHDAWHKEYDDHDGYSKSEMQIATENALNATPQQTADQVLRWHKEWLGSPVGYQWTFDDGDTFELWEPVADAHMVEPVEYKSFRMLFAIPALPDSAASPETDMDMALRHQ